MFDALSRRISARYVLLVLALGVAGPASSALDYSRLPPVQDIAVVPAVADTLVLATTAGLLLASGDGRAAPLALTGNNITALASDPSDPTRFYASGRDRDGAALGLMSSTDGGRQWQVLSVGASGPAAYRAITVSPDSPKLLYASYDGLQRSRDGGASWDIVARGPWEVFSLAIAPGDGTTLYASSRGGLYVSTDGGISWRPAHPAPYITGALAVGPDGELWTFIIGRGLLRSRDPEQGWRTVNNSFGEQVLLRLVLDPRDARHLYALNQYGRVIESRDAGLTWTSFGGARGPTTEAGRRGQQSYESSCQACHGVSGVGETLTELGLADPNYLRAPALDDSTHAWHHSDDNIVTRIFEGSPRTPRMPAFAGQINEAQARDIVIYMKSLWGPRALRCQGARHMAEDCKSQ